MQPYVPSGASSWRPHPESSMAFTQNSSFLLANADIPSRAAHLVQTDHLHQAFGDFDDHLEDVTIGQLNALLLLP